MWKVMLLIYCLCIGHIKSQETLKNEKDIRFEQEVRMKLEHMEERINKQNSIIVQLQHTIAKQTEINNNLQGQIELTKKEDAVNIKTAITFAKSAFGCESHNISLSCPENKTIFVDRTDYGEYEKECPESTCCLPYPPDCIELVSENDPAKWVSLKVLCDNASSCSYLFRDGIFIDECGASDEIDYMNVYYSCLPEEDNSPVAFNAYSTETREYSEYDLIEFDAAYLNLGQHYQIHNSVFICPVDGIYCFAVNLVNGDVSKGIAGRIMVENAEKTEYQTGPNDHKVEATSAFDIAECLKGQRVWVKCAGSGPYSVSGSNAYSSFSGFLLHSY